MKIGTLTFEDGCWVADVLPHVAIRMKRVFPKAKQTAGTKIKVAATIENARDLDWFIERYDVEIAPSDRSRLTAAADKFREQESVLDELLRGVREPRVFEMAIEPRTYQVQAAQLALSVFGLLIADDLGLGKTCSAICVLTEPMARPALVVCPAHLPPQWQREIKRFVPGLTTHILKTGTPYDIRVGAGSKKRKQMSLSEDYEPVLPDVIITSYAKLAGWASHLAPFIRSVIYDEAHEFRVGNSLKCDAGYTVSENCIYRLGLTATPIWNNGVEIYHVINQLRHGALGSLEEFTREWCSQGGVVTDPAALGTYLRTSGLMLRRRRKDVGRELPPVQVQVIDCAADQEAFAEANTAATALARIILSQDATFHERGQASLELDWRVRQATGLAKAKQVAAMVRMLVETGEKVVLFGWHRAVYDVWLEALKDLNPVLYTGTESPRQKEAAREAFVNGAARVLIMSNRSGSGLDGLQSVCRTVVIGELDWSPGVHEQCIGRIERDGQEYVVMVYYMVTDDGSDPVISDVLGLKREQARGLNDPDAPLIEVQSEGGHAKRLAEAYIAKINAAKAAQKA